MAGIRVAVLCAIIQVAGAGGALAQVPQASAGATVFVTPTDDGPELKGRLVEFGPQTLTLLANGQRTTLPMNRVQRIDLHGDPLKNGAIIGAAVYAGMGLLMVGSVSEQLEARMVVPMVLIQGGVGALIGAGIDALHRGRTPLYRRTASLAVASLRKGVAVGLSIRF